LKARQEAFEQIIKQAEAQAKRQQEAYDEQQRRIAHEHEDHMTRLRQENDRLLKEATEVRDQFVRSFKIEPAPTVSAIVERQSRHYYEDLTNQMGLRAQRLQDDYETEVKRRLRKEEDLKDAERKIEKLQKHLQALESMLEASAKRAVPARSQEDSPELHAVKRSKIEEVNEGGEAFLESPAPRVEVLERPAPRKKFDGNNFLEDLARGQKKLDILRTKYPPPRKEVYNVQESPGKDVTSSSAPPPARSPQRGQWKEGCQDLPHHLATKICREVADSWRRNWMPLHRTASYRQG
jgi:hypothetical protein